MDARTGEPDGGSAAIELDYPFAGAWLVQNSPSNRIPSHGTSLFASSYAIDFLPVDSHGRSAPVSLSTWVRPEPADLFPGFGRAVLAPTDGAVIAIADTMVDHPAFRGLPSVYYALTQQRRVASGWPGLAGNHVMLRTGDIVIALCHLQRGSVAVEVGQTVRAGEPIGRCGNSGNSTEPHVHMQAFTGPHPESASPVRMIFPGEPPRNGTVLVV